MTGYEALLELVRRERTLVAEGRYDEATAAGAEWRELAAGLPPEPPEEARPLLAEAQGVVRETVATLVAARAAASAELAHLRRGRRAMASYAAVRRPTAFESRG